MKRLALFTGLMITFAGLVVITPTATATATATFTPTPSPAAGAVAAFKAPHGNFELDGGWTAPVPDGVSMRKTSTGTIMWVDIEPSEGQFDWTQLDAWAAQAVTNHKEVAYSFTILTDPPQWLIDKGIPTYQWTGGYGGLTYTVVMPWDALSEITAFINACGQHMDGKFDYVVMAGVGMSNESDMGLDPSVVGLTADQMLTKWLASSNAIIDAYCTSFKQTPSIFAAACPPINNYAASTTALDTMCRAAAAKYPHLFGVMCDGLSATSSANYVPNKLVKDLSDTNPTGFQMVTGNLNGTLQQTLDFAVAQKAHFVEVYSQWFTTANADILRNASAQMAQFTTPPPTIGNISTRGFVQTGNDVMIGGFIVQGTGPKTVIIRAIGPELIPPPYNIPNALADPTLELHNGTGALIASNDNWQSTIIGGIITADQVTAIQTSGHAPTQPSESAIIGTLQPGNYTAIARGVNNTTGVALVEVYDLGTATGSVLGNISTRGFVQTGNDVMIGGFIVQGTEPKTVIIRAIGPELIAPPYNIPNALADPTLELHDGTGALIGSNDNWQTTVIGGIITSSQVSAIQNSGHVPTQPSESAIVATLQPGNYTAIVSGVNNTVGVALVEVDDLQ